MAKLKKISLEDARRAGMFGPLYHGTTPESRERVQQEGFKIPRDVTDSRNGYPNEVYHGGVPAPIHHLGYGVYFTTNKVIAKKFNGGTVKGLKVYFIQAPRQETINWGAPGTMMKWWLSQGYNYPEILKAHDVKAPGPQEMTFMREQATENLTKTLSSKYDAVWYKGRGLRTLLDGDQVCVYDPSIIYEIDPKLARGFDLGAKVKRNSDGMQGTVVQRNDDIPWEHFPEEKKRGATKRLKVRWKKGGTEHNVWDCDVTPVNASFMEQVRAKYRV